MLNTCASGVLICSTVSFSILGDIPSTSLLLRVSLAHTLAKIGDDAGAFILFSLVSATQRRRQLPPAAGAHRSI